MNFSRPLSALRFMKSLKQKAYEHIRGKMLSGELSPGARLSNRKLAAEVGVSFIPVREAIGQLVSEGLAEHRLNYGAVVRNPSREELADLYDLRLALECHSVKAAASHLGPADILELEQRHQQFQDAATRMFAESTAQDAAELTREMLASDAAFHLVIMRAAGNSLIIKTLSDLRVMERVFGHRRVGWKWEALARIVEEHRRILECLQRGDGTAAADAMAHHIERGQKVALEAFDRERASEAARRAFAGELEGQI
jgi:DNA-binding GntR family transcriptional regulator